MEMLFSGGLESWHELAHLSIYMQLAVGSFNLIFRCFFGWTLRPLPLIALPSNLSGLCV